MENLKVLELFAGYGSQSMSLRDENIPHDVVGIAEIEPDAIIAYGAIRFNVEDLHTDKTHDEMRATLIAKNVGYDFKTGKSKIPRMKKDKLEMLYKFDQAVNNLGDVSIINPNSLPEFDYMTMSFPCQDISISGKQQGIVRGGTRSGMLYECEKIIEAKKPKYILMENVKALVSKKFRGDFDAWCEYLESLGYTNYHNDYKCLNAKDFGIAQNRERIFMWSVLGEHTPYDFPQGFKLTKRLKDFLEDEIQDKYYLSEEIQKRFRQIRKDVETDGVSTIDKGVNLRKIDVANCITTREDRGVSNRKGEGTAIVEYHNQKVELPCCGAIRGRYSEDGNIEQQLELRNDGVVNTVTTVQKDNVVVINKRESFTYNPSGENVIGQMSGDLGEKRHEQTRRVYDTETISPTIPTCSGGGQHPKVLEHQTICEQRSDEGLRFFKDNVCGTVRTINSGGDKRVIETDPSFRIRKLTPKECLRLMGVSDSDIVRMQSVGLSDSSLYKLAGNSIVKQVLDALHRNMFKKVNNSTPSE